MFIWIELQNNNQMKYGLKPFFQCVALDAGKAFDRLERPYLF